MILNSVYIFGKSRAQVNGGSLNYPPILVDLIYLPSLWFQQVWKSLKPSSDGILSLDDLSHNGFTKFNKKVKPSHAKIIVKVCPLWAAWTLRDAARGKRQAAESRTVLSYKRKSFKF